MALGITRVAHKTTAMCDIHPRTPCWPRTCATAGYNAVPNYDFAGNDIGSAIANSGVDDCRSRCTNDARCKVCGQLGGV